MNKFLVPGIVVVALLTVPVLVFARIGVGVGTGKIVVNQPMKAGLIYTLPSLTVLNTGDEPSEYGVGIQFRENQPELRPDKSWFDFEPSTFSLEPGESQVVKIKLSLPVTGAAPGEYFSFLQGFPMSRATAGGTSVGIAAATKLYFTVAPANIFMGLYYRVGSLFSLYAPWSYVISTVILVFLGLKILRRFVSFNLGISVKRR